MSTNLQKISWVKIKKNNYMQWRDKLYTLTLDLMTKSDKVQLSDYNDAGYFHRVPDTKHYERMEEDRNRIGFVPVSDDWIAKGHYPGIWTAMFDPQNTFSMAPEDSLNIIRIYFKEGYFVYDNRNQKHQEISKFWKSTAKNPWRTIRNENRESMRDRMRRMRLPHHKKFYEENKFGAVVGYSDYISPVILLGDSVKKVDFIKNLS